MKNPVIEDKDGNPVPGLVWRKLKNDRLSIGWQCRSDIAKEGFRPKFIILWTGKEEELTQTALDWIADRATIFQDEMLGYRHDGFTQNKTALFTGTVASLIECYLTDKDSPYREKRHVTRMQYDKMCDRLRKDHGDELLVNIKARDIKNWHNAIASTGKIAMAHAVIGMFRTLVGFGVTMIEDDECERLVSVLRVMRFPTSQPRTQSLNAEQAIAVRRTAHAEEKPSIALAQALQFECTLRQKDVIGEWVPVSEPGLSSVTQGNSKWLRGLDWREVDQNWVLRHVTSKRQKEIVINLSLATMVMEELGSTDRSAFPASGPMVVSELTGAPWTAHAFRQAWRTIATKAGVPKSVRNMDSRSGAITEALRSGARPDAVRKAATHSNLSMTTRYSRSDAEEIEEVMKARAAARNKTGNSVA